MRGPETEAVPFLVHTAVSAAFLNFEGSQISDDED
jgi:hypothetical protein